MKIELTRGQYEITRIYPLLGVWLRPNCGGEIAVVLYSRDTGGLPSQTGYLGKCTGYGSRSDTLPACMLCGLDEPKRSEEFWADHEWVEIPEPSEVEVRRELAARQRELAKARADRNSFDRRRREARQLASDLACQVGRWRDLYLAACVRAENVPSVQVPAGDDKETDD